MEGVNRFHCRAGETEAQRGQASCLKSHRREGAEPRLKPRFADFRSHPLPDAASSLHPKMSVPDTSLLGTAQSPWVACGGCRGAFCFGFELLMGLQRNQAQHEIRVEANCHHWQRGKRLTEGMAGLAAWLPIWAQGRCGGGTPVWQNVIFMKNRRYLGLWVAELRTGF